MPKIIVQKYIEYFKVALVTGLFSLGNIYEVAFMFAKDSFGGAYRPNNLILVAIYLVKSHL